MITVNSYWEFAVSRNVKMYAIKSTAYTINMLFCLSAIDS